LVVVAAQVTAALERQMAPHGRAPNLRLVDNYVAAFHVKDSELLHWAMTHPEYTRPQVSSHPPLQASKPTGRGLWLRNGQKRRNKSGIGIG
jgi:hypothetical protein